MNAGFQIPDNKSQFYEDPKSTESYVSAFSPTGEAWSPNERQFKTTETAPQAPVVQIYEVEKFPVWAGLLGLLFLFF